LFRRFQQGPAARVANLTPLVGWTSSDFFLDGRQPRDAFQSLSRNGGFVRNLEIVKLSTYVSPTRCFLNAPCFIDLIKAGVSIRLQNAGKSSLSELGDVRLCDPVNTRTTLQLVNDETRAATRAGM